MSAMTGGEFEEKVLLPTLSARLTCPQCRAEFTFEEGGTAAIAAGIHGKVMCPSCHSVYDVDVTTGHVALVGPAGARRSSWWSRLRGRG